MRAAGRISSLAAVLLVLGCSAEPQSPPPAAPESDTRAQSEPAGVPAAAPSPAPSPAPEAAPPEASEAVLTRDQLFDIGAPEPPDGELDLEAIAAEADHDAVPADRTTADVLRERARLRHEERELGPEASGRHEGGVAEAGVALPVDPDESVHIRSGVRVDYEKDQEGSLEGEPVPTVGVEVNF